MKSFSITIAALATVSIYLFVSAPEPLPDRSVRTSQSIPVEKALQILANQQDIARALYTSEIVAAGQKSGLNFGEKWKIESVEEGPLPALLLRETATIIRQRGSPLGLFLGSDFPISPSNKFSDEQMATFLNVKSTGAAVFSVGARGTVLGMFPDFASAQGCVTCHNEHPESPKTNWQLNEIMGAATWTYPKSMVGPEELAAMLETLRNSLKDAYSSYINKAAGFDRPPEIGAKWPRDGYFLPTPEAFVAEFDRRGAGVALNGLLSSLTAGQQPAPTN